MIGSTKPWEARLIVRNNIISDNEVYCVASHGGGIFLTYPPFTQAYKDKKSGIEIYNNLIAGNYCEEFGGGLSFWDQNSYGEKWLSPSPLIYNNTIVETNQPKGRVSIIMMQESCSSTTLYGMIFLPVPLKSTMGISPTIP